MKTQYGCKTKTMAVAKVLSNKAFGERLYRIVLRFSGEAARLFSNFQPGQFAEFDLKNLAIPPKTVIPNDLLDIASKHIILRRPFSFANIYKDGSRLIGEVLYNVLGPATLRMTTLKKGEDISLIGPLGRGFTVPKEIKTAILVAGGMGAPPIQHLAHFLAKRHKKILTAAFAGAKTKSALPFTIQGRKSDAAIQLKEFSKLSIQSFVATDDGSAGFKGMITDCLSRWLDEYRPIAAETTIYACGPEPMLAATAAIAHDRNIKCQVSMERMMACGIGICQSCAVESRQENSEETIYKLCCKDGPVFDSREVIWEK